MNLSEPVHFRASGLGKCTPELLADVRNPVIWDLKENPRALFLMQGHSNQAATSMYLKMLGLSIAEEEREVRWDADEDGFYITGHIDIVLSELQDVLEVKWLMAKNWRKVVKAPELWHELYPGYLSQLSAYVCMNHHGHTAGRMVIGNRDTGDLIHNLPPIKAPHIWSGHMYLENDDAWEGFRESLDKLKGVMHHLDLGTTPSCDKLNYCWYCNPPAAKADIGGSSSSGRKAVMTDDDRSSLIEQAREAIRSSG